MTSTIFALATAPGRAAVAVVRLSGPDTAAILAGLGADQLEPRRAELRVLRDRQGAVLDHALVLWFPGPRSYTGEDCGELQLHGGSAVVDAVTSVLLEAGARLAEPGEFTRRAFENGKLDLGQAEAVADLVDAETTGQARQAIAQLEGALGERYRGWRGRLLEILGCLEAAVDFPDEEVPAEIHRQAQPLIEDLLADIDAALADAGRGRRIREGYRVAIIGAPNAGKSSLLNALAGRDAAIVTPLAGTTRDIIETVLVLEGFRVVLADMAGLRDTDDVIEAEGVRRARAFAQSADLRLWMVDGSASGEAWRWGADLVLGGDICLVNKNDLPQAAGAVLAAAAAESVGAEVLAVSLAAGDAGKVLAWLSDRVRRDLSGAEFPAATRERHLRLLRSGQGHLLRALAGLDTPELAAEDIRLCSGVFGRLTGEISVEDVLGEVFGRFCIGK